MTSFGRLLHWTENLLWLAAAVMFGVCSYAWLDAAMYQSYANWSFVRTLNGQPVSPQQFARSLIGPSDPLPPPRFDAPPLEPEETSLNLARLEIPRLGYSVMVGEGTDRQALAIGVGHIPGTALPGPTGNVGLAGHRDTFFRRLGELKVGDSLRLRTLIRDYEYTVTGIRIVLPSATEVLAATESPSLTLVTCYPLWGLGAAPERYIVQAALVPR